MNARSVLVGAVVLLVLAAGGAAWWTLSEEDEPATEADPSASTEPEPEEPSPTAEPAGDPIAACAPEGSGGRLPSDYWGMHVMSPVGEAFPEAPVRAVNLTTSGVYWDQVETAPGQYDFALLDDIVATSESRDAKPMLVMGFTPPFHAEQPDSPTARSTMPDLDAWRAWVSAVVGRYGDRIDYQVWPEPNIISNWSDTPEQMARLTAIAGAIIHEQAPDATVTAPATTLRMASQRDWMDRFWATKVDGRPVADSVDAVALDPFPLEDGTPEDSLDLICQAKDILASHDVDLPVWTNEINYGVPSGGPSSGVEPYSDERQAAVVARTFVLHAALGVPRVYWLGWFSYPGLAVEMERDGATTPAGRAYTVVHDWMAGGTLPTCTKDGAVYSCVVRRDGQTVSIHWRTRGTSSVPADGATAVETIDGARRPLQPDASVRVNTTPVAVFSSGG